MAPEKLPSRYDDREDITEEYAFDELAKGVADGTLSRRRAIKLVAGAVLGGGLLALFPADPAEAQEGHVGGGGGRRRRRRRRRRGGGGGGGGPTCLPQDANCEAFCPGNGPRPCTACCQGACGFGDRCCAPAGTPCGAGTGTNCCSLTCLAPGVCA